MVGQTLSKDLLERCVRMEAPTQEQLLALWNSAQQQKKKKQEYNHSERGRAINRAKGKRFYEANREKVLEQRKAWYAENKDKAKEYMRKYHEKKRQEKKLKMENAVQGILVEFGLENSAT